MSSTALTDISAGFTAILALIALFITIWPPSAKTKAAYVAGSVVCGVASVAFMIWAGVVSDQEHKASDQELNSKLVAQTNALDSVQSQLTALIADLESRQKSAKTREEAKSYDAQIRKLRVFQAALGPAKPSVAQPPGIRVNPGPVRNLGTIRNLRGLR